MSVRVSRSWQIPLLFAILAVLFRIPFLLRGDAFFNSDEAVEGLMARHLHEVPLFFWGQGYKGVPEVYLAAAAFRVWPVGVTTLKAVTLACAVVYACLNFHLVARLFSRRVESTVPFTPGPPPMSDTAMSVSEATMRPDSV